MSGAGIGRNGGPRVAGVGILLALSLAGLLGACDDGPPTRPSPPLEPRTAPPPAPVSSARLEIGGPSTVPPGESVQYSAIAHQSDGSTRDVTNEAAWRTWDPSVLTISSTGLATGRERGETGITVNAGGRDASTQVMVVPAGTYRLAGTVRDEGLPVAGARVEVTSGTGRGLAVTDILGGYRFYGAAGDIEVRVTRDGFQEQRKSLRVTSHQTLHFDLVLSRPRHEVAGTYVLTVTAAAECPAALPRVRTYTAVLRQEGPRLTATLQGPKFFVFGNRSLNSFHGVVEPGNVWFQLSGPYDYYGSFYFPEVLEEIDATTFLAVSGTAVTTVSSAGLSGALYGRFETLRSVGPEGFETVESCFSTAHPFVFTR